MIFGGSMADKNRDPAIVALEAVYAALKDLDAAARKKVLSSVFALLDIEQPRAAPAAPPDFVAPTRQVATSTSRPVSLNEIINEKKPGTNAQRIAIFAYFREKTEGLTRFGRDDLKPYFAKAKLAPASNFDRDFVEAVKKGWIHEDGLDSYLTTKGIEAIESEFEGERRYTKGRKGAPKKRGGRAARSKPKAKRKS
jgi:hypothetical protein